MHVAPLVAQAQDLRLVLAALLPAGGVVRGRLDPGRQRLAKNRRVLGRVDAAVAEPLSPAGWTAVGVIVAGAIVLAGDGLRTRRVGARALAIVGANILVIAAYTLVDGSGVRASGNAPSYIGWMFALTALTLVLARPWLGSRGLPQSHGVWGLLGVGAACTLGSYGIVLWAMTLAPIGLVAALRETSIVFGTVIAAAMLRERVSPQRWAGVALVAAGAAAMRLA